MSNIQIFENSEFGQVRTLEDNNQMLFCGSDIARALGYVKPQNAIKQHCKGAALKRGIIDSMGRAQDMIFITRGDVYRLVTKSKLDSAQRFESWVFDEVIPSIHDHGTYSILSVTEYKERMAKTREENIRIRKAQSLIRMADQYDGTYKQVLHSYATKELVGEPLIPLPTLEQKTYSANEIGEILSISAHKVGTIANAYGLKTEEYGKWFHDKSRSSSKEVQTFRYFENAIKAVQDILRQQMSIIPKSSKETIFN